MAERKAEKLDASAGKKAKEYGKKAGEATYKGVKKTGEAIKEGAVVAGQVAKGALEGFSEGVGYTALGKEKFDKKHKNLLNHLGQADPQYDQYEKMLQEREHRRKIAVATDRRKKVEGDLAASKSRARENRSMLLNTDRKQTGRRFLADPKLREQYERVKAIEASGDTTALEAFYKDNPARLNSDEVDAMRRAESSIAGVAEIKRREDAVNDQISAQADLIDFNAELDDRINRSSTFEKPKTDPRIVAAERKRKQDEARIEKENARQNRPHGLSDRQLDAYARQRRNAQADAEKSGGFVSVDQRERNRQLRNVRADRLVEEAHRLGYKNVTRDSVLASLDKRFVGTEGAPTHDDLMSMMSTMRNDLYKNANKRFMAERGGQMLADQRAREEAIRNDPRAAARRAELSRQWGGNSQGMSHAQADAQARWKAQREAASGSRGNISARKAYAGYEGSIRHGADTFSRMQRDWGYDQGRSLLPRGSSADSFVNAYEFNRQYNDAQLRRANAEAAQAEQRVNYLTKATTDVKIDQNPTKSQENAIGAVSLGRDSNNIGGV